MRIVPHEDHLSAIAPSMSHRLHLALVPTGVVIDSSLPRLIKVDETKLSKTVRRILRVRSVIYTVYDSLSHRIPENLREHRRGRGLHHSKACRLHLHTYLTSQIFRGSQLSHSQTEDDTATGRIPAFLDDAYMANYSSTSSIRRASLSAQSQAAR